MDDLFRYVSEGVQREKGRWQALAEASGVSYSWITKFGGNRLAGTPNMGTLQKLAEALKSLPQ